MNTLIVINNLGSPRITITPEALELKEAAILKAQGIEEVFDADSQALAVEALRNIKLITKQTEDGREAIKKPVIKIGKEIDATSKEFVLELNQEASRLSGLVSKYQDVMRRAELEAERKRLEEQRKFEAKADKLEAQGKPVPEFVPKTIAVVAPKAAGLAVTKQPRYEVTDIKALYAARPDLCKLEVSGSAVISAMRDGLVECPGLKLWWETSAQVRV